eukprot:4068317-Ditylum_brightwellii.AAC.1
MPAAWAVTTCREKLIYNATLTDMVYSADNTTVVGALKKWKNGRAVMISLRDCYSGPGEVAKRTVQAKKMLEDLFYRNKVGLTFEKFVTILNCCFFDLARGG